MSTKDPPNITASTDAAPEVPGGREFGQRLRAARSARGMTLREVANEAGVSIAYLSDLERAVLANPTLDKLRAIADALRVSIDELLGDNGPRETGEGRIPAELREFVALDAFRIEVEAAARRWRCDPNELRAEWIELLANLRIAGRRPASAGDYQFIFESIRRAVEAR